METRSGHATLLETKPGRMQTLRGALVPPRATGAGGERQWLRAQPEDRGRGWGHVAAGTEATESTQATMPGIREMAE